MPIIFAIAIMTLHSIINPYKTINSISKFGYVEDYNSKRTPQIAVFQWQLISYGYPAPQNTSRFPGTAV